MKWKRHEIKHHILKESLPQMLFIFAPFKKAEKKHFTLCVKMQILF